MSVSVALGGATKSSYFTRIMESGKPVLDLDEQIRKTGTEERHSILENGTTIRLVYPASCENGAGAISQMLERVVRATLEPVESIARTGSIVAILLEDRYLPLNIRYIHRSERPEYAQILLMDSCEVKQWWTTRSILEGVYLTLPHELLHASTGRALADTPRWLREGLSEYVAMAVAQEFAPSFASEVLARDAPLCTFLNATDREIRKAIKKGPPRSKSRKGFEAVRHHYLLYHGALLASEHLTARSPIAAVATALGESDDVSGAELVEIALGMPLEDLIAAKECLRRGLIETEKAVLEESTQDARRELAAERLRLLIGADDVGNE